MTNGKKDILIIMGRYLPGYKDGGPVRTIKNLVDYLGEEYNFKILTCDRDHGDLKSYAGIEINAWNKVGNAQVYYVKPKGFNFSTIKRLSKQADLIYCCGCFNDYAINTLILKKLNQIKIPVVIASMGLFSPMEFKLKYKKKKIFISLFNFLGMFKNIYWSATSETEIMDIRQQVKVSENYFIAEDLPRIVNNQFIKKDKEVGSLKVFWISRIAPKKNLKGAIQMLKEVKGDIEFSIYGPKHVEEYWKECRDELNTLPSNIKWCMHGDIDSEMVVEILKKEHVFLFPTLGENYGHVIQEALSAGCPVIVSNQTPWNDLEKNGAGYICSLNDTERFKVAIEAYIQMTSDEFQEVSNRALMYVKSKSNNRIENTGYRKIFEGVY